MIKVRVVTTRGGVIRSKTKIDCKGNKALVAECMAAIGGVCEIAQKNIPGLTPEILLKLAGEMIEDKKGREEHADE